MVCPSRQEADPVMRLDAAEARVRFAGAQVLRLATAGSDGQPHIVPCTFVVDSAGLVAIGIDNKPKSSTNLRRLRNIAENPRVSLLVDHYDNDWNQLWWARADGTATIDRSGAGNSALWESLRRKYPQYSGELLGGPVIMVEVRSWTGWSFAS